MVKFIDPCPTCFMNKGYSIELTKRDDGTFVCPQDPAHKFIKDKDGYFIRV